MKKKNPYQIYREDGKNSFVEIVGNMLHKGIVVINFCEYDEKTNKQTSKIDLYVETPKFLGLMNGMLNGEFRQRIEKAKAEGVFEGEKVSQYTSYFMDMGGANEDKVKEKFNVYQERFPWLKEGMAISRQFKVQTGTNSKYPYVFRGEVGPGKSNDKGLIVPQGRPMKYTNIPFTYDSIMACASICVSYISAFYAQHLNVLAPSLWKMQTENYDMNNLPGNKSANK